MTYNIAVCDDNPTDAAYISALAKNWARAGSRSITLSSCKSGEEFLFHYGEEAFDILLLDIEMKEINGVELAKKIRLTNEYIQIIFITGYPDFVSEGYEVSALHYLMKPVREDKLFTVLDKACRNLARKGEYILFPADSGFIRMPKDEIMFVEAFAHFVRITAFSKTIEIRKSISEMEKLLGDGFIRCHRSYIAGLRFIRSITKTAALLDSGQEIPISRNCYNEVNQAFIRYFKEQL